MPRHWLAFRCAVALAPACTVPDIDIEEAAAPVDTRPTSKDGGSGSTPIATGSSATAPNRIDAGPSQPPGAGGSTAGSVAAVGGSSGTPGTPPPAPAGGTGPTTKPPSAGHSADDDDAGQPPATAPTAPRSCVVWRSANARDDKPPDNAVEGGLESVAGPPTKQYVCRVRPAGSAYAIPGKYVVGLGCYVAYRVNGTVTDASVLDGLFDVLTPGAGCTFSWRTASSTLLPAAAVDLGDPLGGPHYACRGYYSSIASSGTQIGNIIPTRDTAPQQECWFQSFEGTSQPQEPAKFEVLSLD